MPSAASPKFAKQYSLFTPNFFVMKICRTLSQEAFVSRNRMGDRMEQNGGHVTVVLLQLAQQP